MQAYKIYSSSFERVCFVYFSLLLFPSSLQQFASLTCPMASSTVNRWLRPEVYPLFAAVGTAVYICVMQLMRNITTNPDVRVLKENRAAGVLDNLGEGEKYREHGLRKYVRNKPPEIMPSVNGFFSKPNQKGDS